MTQRSTSNILELRMQALSVLSMPQTFLDFDDFAFIPPKAKSQHNSKEEIFHEDENVISGEEFSFACTENLGIQVSADEFFENGEILPFSCSFEKSNLFNGKSNVFTSPLRPPLKKIFVKQNNNFFSGPSVLLKESHNDPLQNVAMREVEALNDSYQKSNSTGFSKLWRFRRHLKLRSKSDGQDSFVYLSPPLQENYNKVKVKNELLKKGCRGIHKRKMSVHEKLYVMNRMRKESTKGKSFLPYKQNLLGLFFSSNTLSKNNHPF